MHKQSTLGQNHRCATRKRAIGYLWMDEPRVLQSCTRLRKFQTRRRPILQTVTKFEKEPNGLQPQGGCFLTPELIVQIAPNDAQNTRQISTDVDCAERSYDRMHGEQANVAHHAKVTGAR